MDGDTEISVVVEICGTDTRARASTPPFTLPRLPLRCPNSHSDAPNRCPPPRPPFPPPFCHPACTRRASISLAAIFRTENASRREVLETFRTFSIERLRFKEEERERERVSMSLASRIRCAANYVRLIHWPFVLRQIISSHFQSLRL